MSTTAIIKTTFQGRNGSGVISVPEVLEGDVMVMACIASTQPLTNEFYPLISTDGQVYQNSSGDESGNSYTAIFIRQV